MDTTLATALRYGLVFYILLVCSICIHEWAHAFVADKLGDPLPRTQGRVTLNPMAHMDKVGTVILPLLMIFSPLLMGAGAGLVLFGWGRPVQISLPNPKTRVRDDLLISAAGPLANLTLCLLLAVTGGQLSKLPFSLQIEELFSYAIFINAALFVFNLIPIPPLDGSHFLRYATGMRAETFNNLTRYGFLILLIMLFFGPFQQILQFGIYSVAGLFKGIMLVTAGG
jgi:Zn-dependent protease